MAFGKKPCCDGCARKPSKARISGNPIAHLFQMGGEVMKDLESEGWMQTESTDPLFIHEDEGYNTAVLSDMVRREIDEEEALAGMPDVPVEEESISDIAIDRLKAAGQGYMDAPGFVANYLLDFDEKGRITPISPSELGFDALNLGKGILSYAQEDPLGFTLDLVPGLSNIRAGQDSNALYVQAEKLEEDGDFLGAAKTRSLATLSAADMFNPLPGGVFLKGIIAGPMARRSSQRLNDPRLKEIEESGDYGVKSFNERPAPLEEAVFNEKGAFIGADGKPKFEIDTSNVTVDKGILVDMYAQSHKLMPGESRPTSLGELLDFPELFDNYPELRDIPVRLRTLGRLQKAQYTRNANPFSWRPHEIDLDLNYIEYTPDFKDFTSSLLHEVQHAVQDMEGFLVEGFLERGSVPSDMLSFDEYLALPIEIEARNVQRRFEDPTLRTQLPETTVDIFPDTATDPMALRQRAINYPEYRPNDTPSRKR